MRSGLARAPGRLQYQPRKHAGSCPACTEAPLEYTGTLHPEDPLIRIRILTQHAKRPRRLAQRAALSPGLYHPPSLTQRRALDLTAAPLPFATCTRAPVTKRANVSSRAYPPKPTQGRARPKQDAQGPSAAAGREAAGAASTGLGPNCHGPHCQLRTEISYTALPGRPRLRDVGRSRAIEIGNP